MISGETVCEDYQIIKKVGQGSFGYVYKIRHRITHELYALKTDQKSITKMQLENQVKVLQWIQQSVVKKMTKIQNIGHLGKCLSFYPSQQNFNKMIMPLYGQNIYNLFHKCNKRFDTHTIYQVALGMLKNIEYLHSLGFIHRDIKPQNFVVGSSYDQKNKGDSKIYLVDFGLSKTFLKSQIEHIPYEIGRKIRGTPMYMSINVLLGIEPSRRDDLQSLLYIVVLFIKGRLPWHNMKITKKDFNQLIISKISIDPDILFQNLPKQLKDIYIYIRKLKFQEKPNFEKISKSFQSILAHKNIHIQEEYNQKYQNYCWQMVLEKQNLNFHIQTHNSPNKKQNIHEQKQITLLH